MASQQQRYRNLSSDNRGRERMPSDEGFYQGRLKSTDGRKGTSVCVCGGEKTASFSILALSLSTFGVKLSGKIHLNFLFCVKSFQFDSAQCVPVCSGAEITGGLRVQVKFSGRRLNIVHSPFLMHQRPPHVVLVSRSPFTSGAVQLGRLSHCRCGACGLQRATLFLFVHSFGSSGFHVKLLKFARYCIVASPTFTFLQRLAYFPVAFRGGQMIYQRTKRQNHQIVFT